MQVLVVVLLAVLVASVAGILLVTRRRRARRAQGPLASEPIVSEPIVSEPIVSEPEVSLADAVPSLWPAPEPRQGPAPDTPPDPDAAASVDEPAPAVALTRSDGWRGRVPFASPLSTRLAPAVPAAPAELVASFDALAATAAVEELVATLAALGYEVRWRRPAELALGHPDGRVARILLDERNGTGATVGVELEPDEAADVAVGLVDRLRAGGYRLERREATTLLLRDGAGATATVTRVPGLRA